MDHSTLNLNVKARLETLLKWLVPVFVLTTFVKFFSVKIGIFLLDEMAINSATYKSNVSSYMTAIQIFTELDNLVVSVWLYHQSKDFAFNKVLWPIFGLIQPYFAIAFFFISLFMQQGNEKLSNHAIKADEK